MSDMTRAQRPVWLRMAWGGLAVGLALVLNGDQTAQSAVASGIDPLEVLKLQIKPNVLLFIDTSGSIQESPAEQPDPSREWPGGDDFSSKMAQMKKAAKFIITQHEADVNFGLLTFFAPNSSKTLDTGNGDVNDGNNPYNHGGTLEYVSDQLHGGGTTWTGTTAASFFRNIRTDNSNNYNNATGAEVYESFQSWPFLVTADVSGGVCTVEPCRRFLRSRLLRNSVKFTWNTTTNPPPLTGGFVNNAVLVSTTAITCPLAPMTLFPDDPDVNSDGLSDIPRPCFQLQDSAGNVSTFWYTAANWGFVSNCNGALLKAAVAACNTDIAPQLLDLLKPELPIDGSCAGSPVGIPCGISPVTTLTPTPYTPISGTNPAATAGLNPDVVEGLIAAGSTPTGAALNYILTNFNTVFPNQVAGQTNAMVMITDGQENCGGNPVAAATALYNHNPRVTSYFIALGTDPTVPNTYALAGSGGTQGAFPVADLNGVIQALETILNQVVTTGLFSASNQVAGTVFELVTDDPSTPVIESPSNPQTRYNVRTNILYQSLFGLPGWQGHVEAFDNTGNFVPVTTTISGNWDAGEALLDQVTNVLVAQTRGTGRTADDFVFQELHNGATWQTIVNENPAAGGALIKRRIFTSNGSGTFNRDGTNDGLFNQGSPIGTNVVALWPPIQVGGTSSGLVTADAVDPVNVATPGVLDDALGIGPGSNPVLTYANLQTQYGACTGSTSAASGAIPAACNVAVNPTLALNTARKEAREVLLAFIAGAELDYGTTDNLPKRAKDAPVTGQLLFRDRGWLLLDSTYSTPAILSPPIGDTPTSHLQEYLLFRDGRRDANNDGKPAEIDMGFGLANPDLNAANASDPTLKPIMTTLFVGANDMLHAFNASTSEEEWGLIPFDQLGKIALLLNPGQVRAPHVYLIATSLRLATIFIPDVDGFTLSNPTSTSFSGRWRNVLIFGRGAGGKFLTTLDVTSPGPYTRSSLATNPPWVMWNRGNPDALDPTNYATMGETWSTPAVGEVTGPSDGTDWRAFVGSGFTDVPGEGRTFYNLKMTTGDVLLAKDVGNGSPTYIPQNVLVAPPAAYDSYLLDYPGKSPILRDPTTDKVTRVYIPDVHGRVWKFDTNSGALFADLGPTQPFGAGPALLKLSDQTGDKPLIFLNSGDDTRVPDSAGPFNMYEYKDIGLDSPGGVADAVQQFVIPFPAPPPSNVPFRGTTRPATGYTLNSSGAINGIAFFAGTRFNPAGINCVSSFDTIVFAPAVSGTAAGYTPGYDFLGTAMASLSYTIQGQLAGNITTTGGTVEVSLSGNLGGPPPPGGGAGVGFPGPAPTPTPGPPASPTVDITKELAGSPVCRE